MARSLKTRGIAELNALRNRTLRQHALGRIERTDEKFILIRLGEIEARITAMRELDENGKEEGAEWL